MNKVIFNYLQNVLGLKTMPKPELMPTQWKVVFVSEQSLLPAEEALLEKITKAMNLSESEWCLLGGAWAKEIDKIEKSQHVICFSQSLRDHLQTNFPELPLVLIPSLAAMIEDPTLKRQAWDSLKSLV